MTEPDARLTGVDPWLTTGRGYREQARPRDVYDCPAPRRPRRVDVIRDIVEAN